MVEIFQFPTREVQFEAGVREMLRLAGLNKEMIDWIWADFIPRYESVRRDISFEAPAECDAALRTVKDYFDAKGGAHMSQMLAIETELYIAKFGLPLR